MPVENKFSESEEAISHVILANKIAMEESATIILEIILVIDKDDETEFE
jgi:hypothetical protein